MSPHRLLPRGRPEAVGVDARGVSAFLDQLARRHIELHTMMLVRHGRVCAEGAWYPHRLDHAPLLYSLSKTFVSAAAGIVVADGAFGYDDRLVDLFADVVEDAGPVASRIRVRDCLAMATGHTTDVWPGDKLAAMPGRKPWRAWLATEPPGEPGVTFCYNQIATWTLAEIVRHATGMTVLELLRERVFGPLGIGHASWDTDQRGRILGCSGLHLAPESIAAFFQLLLDEGVHDGEQLLPAEWITRYRQRQVETAPVKTDPDWAQGYGWQVWLDRHGGHRGDGALGQFGLLMPAHDALLVTTARTDSMQGVLEAAWDHLLPAFDAPASAADTDALTARLGRASLRTVGGERGGFVHLSFENRRNRWRLIDAPEGWTLRWIDAFGGDNTLTVGHKSWEIGAMRWGKRTLRVAASGAWVEWGHWVGHMVALDAPHALLVRLRDDGSGKIEWVGEKPLGTGTWPSLAVER
ncbi:MAG: serine hydrolase domain-containing protein [Propioniciclava sp.]|uniref:serine hydrolase domain-containing protein n=1 Tax=Propioniciclava sp. TaxID=2038686 RepID=UPI0039E3DE94